jgi:cyclopropane fatty-acyl-phospholipid synthase-like methyltransferase
MDADPVTAVEIGCGIGRLTLPMAKRVAELRAVDVSPTMLRRLAENCAAAGVDVVRGFLPQEEWDTGRPVDFAYSRWVLQHIPDFEVIDGYVARLATCMRRGAVAHLQLDTRPGTIGYHLRNALPDFILPRRWRRGVRRIRRTAAELRALFARHGFSVVEELNPDSTDHVFVLARR